MVREKFVICLMHKCPLIFLFADCPCYPNCALIGETVTVGSKLSHYLPPLQGLQAPEDETGNQQEGLFSQLCG